MGSAATFGYSPTEEPYCKGELFGQNHVFASTGLHFFDQAEVSGYSGKLQFSRTTSPDGRQIVLSASSPALANHDWRCFGYSLNSRTHASASNIYSKYDESCDCWYVSQTLDILGTAERAGLGPKLWFTGFAPVPLPPEESAAEKRKHRKETEAREAEETLTKGEAEQYMKVALKRHFGKTFSTAYPQSIDCTERRSKAVRACAVSWVSGSYYDRRVWSGSGRIWLSREKSGKLAWNYSWRLKRVDRRCAKRHSLRTCTKRYVVK